MEFEAEVEPRPLGVPLWYWAVAGLCLLFEGIGCVAYYFQLTMHAQTIDQRAIDQAMPMWTMIAYGAGVGIGLIGAIGLLLRKRFARGALLLSFLFVLAQFVGILAVPSIRGSMSSDELIGPILIALLAYGYWQFARVAVLRGWLS